MFWNFDKWAARFERLLDWITQQDKQKTNRVDIGELTVAYQSYLEQGRAAIEAGEWELADDLDRLVDQARKELEVAWLNQAYSK